LALRSSTTRRRLLTAVAHGVSVSALTLVCGCETKGFIDPTELGRYQHDPLVVPIVSQIDPAIEEADNQWSRASEPTAEDLRPTNADYRISRNDLLNLTLSDINGPNTETVKQARVTESGNISLPYLDQPVHAEGLTEIQLEQAIIEAYRAANLIQHAQVSVTVIEARGRAFSILGSVTQPGEYGIVESDFRLMNALVLGRNVSTPFVEYIYVVRKIEEPSATTQPTTPGTGTAPGTTGPAGNPASAPSSDELAPKTDAGATPDVVAANSPAQVGPQDRHVVKLAAGTESPAVSVSDGTAHAMLAQANQPGSPHPFEGFRDPGPQQRERIIRIPYDALKRGEMQYNIPIRPHDVIYVADPVTGFYYVGGHVTRPGAYTFSGQKITIKDAIIAASMLDGLAIPQRTDIIRRIQPNAEIFVRVDLDKIFSGQQPDVYLKPGDKLLVGTNALAPFLAAARGSFRLTYGFGFLYDRNYAYSSALQGL
jgi:protein involved in polysaccharide export with SLBB domain